MKMHTLLGKTMLLGLTVLILSCQHLRAQSNDWEILSLFGGSGNDTDPFRVLFDDTRDQIIIVGTTEENDLPVTDDAFQKNLSGSMDGFVLITNLNASKIEFMSYFGGSRNDAIEAACLLDDDRLLICGSTYSLDLPATKDAYYPNHRGNNDGWYAIISLSTRDIQHCSYFGGSDVDGIQGVVKYPGGGFVITGVSSSKDLPTTADAFQRYNFSMGKTPDAFIAIIDSNYSVQFASYHGGKTGGGENARSGITQTEAFLIFSGDVDANDFPTTPDAHQTEFKGGYADAYLTIISKDSLKIAYSTMLGGYHDDVMNEVVPIDDNCLAIFGSTRSDDFPVTKNAYQSIIQQDSTGYADDLFLGIFSLDSMRFRQLTFIGGTGVEFAKGALYDSTVNKLFLFGSTASMDFPLLSEPPSWLTAYIMEFDQEIFTPMATYGILRQGNNFIDCMTYTRDQQKYFVGRTRFTTAEEIKVSPSGFQTVRMGNGDTFIGLFHPASTRIRDYPSVATRVTAFSLYPNPASNHLEISSTREQIVRIKIFGILGDLIYTEDAHDRSHISLDITTMRNGIYLLRIEFLGGKYETRLFQKF